jgi:hypothetical protein
MDDLPSHDPNFTGSAASGACRATCRPVVLLGVRRRRRRSMVGPSIYKAIAMIAPDRNQLEIFVDGMFRHAGSQGFVSMRAFLEEDSAKPFRISPAAMSGGLKFLIDVAEDDANRAANYPKPVVFCPPIAVFANKDSAREADIVEGLALSVECDQHPYAARMKLEKLLGPATFVVHSGGVWTDANGELYDKVHLHWRLREPARGADIADLKKARDLATRLVGGDPSNKPVCHPIRWPGSWHRKAEPVLCRIERANPDAEIDLADTLSVLTAACPEQARSKPNGKDHSAGAPADWSADLHNTKSWQKIKLVARAISYPDVFSMACIRRSRRVPVVPPHTNLRRPVAHSASPTSASP